MANAAQTPGETRMGLDPNDPYEAAFENDEPQSVVGLLKRLTNELSSLFRQEMALATSEITRSLSTLMMGAASMLGGGAVMFAGFLALIAAAILGLAEVLPAWAAALIVGLVVGAIGFVMMRAGKQKLEPSQLKPVRTTESLRRDKDVLARRGT